MDVDLLFVSITAYPKQTTDSKSPHPWLGTCQGHTSIRQDQSEPITYAHLQLAGQVFTQQCHKLTASERVEIPLSHVVSDFRNSTLRCRQNARHLNAFNPAVANH